MKKITVSAFLFFFIFFFLTIKALAADMNVTCPIAPSGCSIAGANPLFTSAADGVWYPGMSLTKTINMKNGGTQIREMALKGTGTTVSDTLKNVMNLSLTSSGGTVIWSGGLADFYNQSNIGLGIFDPDASLDYNMTVSMDSSANDDYQGTQSVFDLTLGFWGDPILTPTPTPAPGGGGGGGGTVLGTGVSAPVCNDTKPGSAPTLTGASAGTNSVTLTWTAASDPVSYYLVTYGASSGAQTWGNPNVGGSGTTSYTVSGLSGGTTYYFRVRAGNGCKPGDFSNELSATPGGGFVAGPAAGFAPGVLGATTASESAQQSGTTITPTPEEGKVLGGETPGFDWKKWLGLGFVTLLLLGILFSYLKSRGQRKEE